MNPVRFSHWTLKPLPATTQHPTGAWQATSPTGHQLTQDRQPAT
jgi:hypothetical protein